MEANDENLAHVAELYKTAVMAELDGVEFLAEFEDGVLAREYNGIGPEWAGEHVRDLVTGKLALFEPAALIHDLRNYLSDGMRRRFHRANDEFLRNCRRCADAKYPWWSWKRYGARATAEMLCTLGAGHPGWKAWMDCYRRRFPEDPEKQTTTQRNNNHE